MVVRGVGDTLAGEPVALAVALVVAFGLGFLAGDVLGEADGAGAGVFPFGSAETGTPNAVDGAQSALSGLFG